MLNLKFKDNKMVCRLTDEVSIMVTNAIEVHGHDDSLPYSADLYASLNDKPFTLIAHCSNDGWGGDSDIRGINTDYQKFVNDLFTLCRERYELHYQNIVIPCSLDSIVDLMVCKLVYGKIGTFDLKKEGYVKKENTEKTNR